MLCREIIFVYSEIHTKQINASSWQETELFMFKSGGTLTNQWILNVTQKL